MWPRSTNADQDLHVASRDSLEGTREGEIG